jgi:hypothetical protein
MEETNFAQKLQTAMQEIENGEYVVRDFNEILDV